MSFRHTETLLKWLQQAL